MLGKVGLTLLVIAIVIGLALALRRPKTPRGGVRRMRGRGQPPRLEAEDLVRCPHCGVYHPEGKEHACTR